MPYDMHDELGLRLKRYAKQEKISELSDQYMQILKAFRYAAKNMPKGEYR